MTNDWDFYFLRVNDRPASIYVDLGAREFAPVANLSSMAYVRVEMNAPRDDGLSSQSEFDALNAIEDRLNAELVDADTAYVGRCTTNSCRDFFFYVGTPDQWERRVAACMSEFVSYKYEADTREEPDWSTYLGYLYPSNADRQRIENRRVCDALERNGDALTATREIDHWAYFPDAGSRNVFVAKANQLGFATRQISDSRKGSLPFLAQVWRSDIPSFEGIDDVTLPLIQFADELNGDYDGWESVVVK